MAKAQLKASKSSKSSVADKPALNGIKAGRVTKATDTPKAKSKEMAKVAAVAAAKEKKFKASTPSDSEDSDSSSDSSSESEAENKSKTKLASKANGVKANGVKANGVSKKAEDSDLSSDSDSDEEEKPAAKSAETNGTVNFYAEAQESSEDSSSVTSESESEAESEVNGANLTSAAALHTEKDSSSDLSSDSDSDEESDDEVAKSKTNGVAKTTNGDEKKADAGDSDDSSPTDSDDSSDSSEDEEEKEKVREEAVSKKRKADETTATPAKKSKSGNPASKNLFVGNLSWNVDDDWLRREFEGFGELAGCRVVTERESGRSRGFGYVEFVEVDSAIQALEEKHGADVDGRPLNVDYSTPRPEQSPFQKRERANQRAERFGDRPAAAPSETLFVGNLSFDIDNDTLGNEFGNYGSVTRVSVPTDPESGAIKGFAYVAFSSVDEAKAAMEGMQGQDILGRPVRLDYATPRTDNPNRSGRGGFGGDRGGRGGFGDRRGGFGGRGGRGGGRGGARGGRGGSTNRGGFGDFKGNKITF